MYQYFELITNQKSHKFVLVSSLTGSNLDIYWLFPFFWSSSCRYFNNLTFWMTAPLEMNLYESILHYWGIFLLLFGLFNIISASDWLILTLKIWHNIFIEVCCDKTSVILCNVTGHKHCNWWDKPTILWCWWSTSPSWMSPDIQFDERSS